MHMPCQLYTMYGDKCAMDFFVEGVLKFTIKL